MNTWLVGAVVLVVLLSLALALVSILRRSGSNTEISTALQIMTQAIQQAQTQTAVLAEKLAHLEPVTQAVGGVKVELKGLADSTRAIRDDLSRAKSDLTELQAQAKARHMIEQQTSDSIRRLEAIIAGTQTKGVAGENILEIVFAKLPPDWQVRNLKVGDKTVEFGLRLPNNLVLPIDSKWAATHLLEQFVACGESVEQQKLKGQIEAAVLDRAKEVRKYIDPNITLSFAVAAVPDAVYDLCTGIQADAFHLNVVLVSYSNFVPYLLLVFQTMLRSTQSIDLHKLDAYLQSAQDSLQTLQEELEGRFSRALTMLGNSRDDMRGQVSKVRSGLTSIQLSSTTPVLALPDASEESDLPVPPALPAAVT